MDDYISREKALQFRLTVNVSRDANSVTVARGVADAIAEYIKAIPAADVRPVKWIPVTERLPDAEPGDVSERVLVTNGTDIAIVEWFNFEECGPFWGYTGFGKDVTHWMPLPDPPEGRDDA